MAKFSNTHLTTGDILVQAFKGYTWLVSYSHSQEWMLWLSNAFLMCAVAHGPEVKLGTAIGHLLARDHRTNQQSVIRAIRELLRAYLSCEPGTDARNEGAVKWAEQAVALDDNLPYV